MKEWSGEMTIQADYVMMVWLQALLRLFSLGGIWIQGLLSPFTLDRTFLNSIFWYRINFIGSNSDSESSRPDSWLPQTSAVAKLSACALWPPALKAPYLALRPWMWPTKGVPPQAPAVSWACAGQQFQQ